MKPFAVFEKPPDASRRELAWTDARRFQARSGPPRLLRAAVVTALAAGILSAAEKGPPSGQAENRNMRIEAVLYLDPASVKEAAGAALGEGVVAVHVTVTPLGSKPFDVRRDDFVLFSDKNGQRTTPYEPSQLAGSSALEIAEGNNGPQLVGPVHEGDENPVLTLLQRNVLPEGTLSKPASGFLYFPLEGSHKVKQIELYYSGPAGKLSVRFDD